MLKRSITTGRPITILYGHGPAVGWESWKSYHGAAHPFCGVHLSLRRVTGMGNPHEMLTLLRKECERHANAGG